MRLQSCPAYDIAHSESSLIGADTQGGDCMMGLCTSSLMHQIDGLHGAQTAQEVMEGLQTGFHRAAS